MVVIFLLSAQPDLSTGLGTWDLIGRKLVHMTEYGLLCFLLWRATREVLTERAAIAAAFCLSLAYSATDEFHQTFVHGRHGTPVDMLIDATGMAIAATLIARRTR
jgi:VanZ family protein